MKPRVCNAAADVDSSPSSTPEGVAQDQLPLAERRKQGAYCISNTIPFPKLKRCLHNNAGVVSLKLTESHWLRQEKSSSL